MRVSSFSNVPFIPPIAPPAVPPLGARHGIGRRKHMIHYTENGRKINGEKADISCVLAHLEYNGRKEASLCMTF